MKRDIGREDGEGDGGEGVTDGKTKRMREER